MIWRPMRLSSSSFRLWQRTNGAVTRRLSKVRSTNRMTNKKAANYCDTKQEQEDDDDSTTGESLVMIPSRNNHEKDWYYL